jgi:hypothetical protein
MTFRFWTLMQERVHMLNKICSWIVAIVALIFLAPLLAYAVGGHSDLGVPLAEILKQINRRTVDDQPEGYSP